MSTFLTILYYLLEIIEIQNIFLLSIFMGCFVVLSGLFISKLAVDPLSEYVRNLQNLSKETLHELNLPISTIKSNAKMISKTLSDEKSLKRVSRIESACQMLEQRYNELDYMIKTQTLQEIYEEIELDILLKERVEFLEALYPQISFNLSLQKSKILNDKIGLSKVIDNIIDNGVKYSKNSTKLDIELKGNTLSIRDYGCGMDEVELLQIFDTYYQSNENMKGFGIGLSMVKRFCDTNEIKLNFKSQKDEGTTVLLQFKQI